MDGDNMFKIYLTKEVAGILRVSEEYVRELIRQRRIKAFREGRRGGFRITDEAIGEYIKGKYEEQSEMKYKDKTEEDKEEKTSIQQSPSFQGGE